MRSCSLVKQLSIPPEMRQTAAQHICTYVAAFGLSMLPWKLVGRRQPAADTQGWKIPGAGSLYVEAKHSELWYAMVATCWHPGTREAEYIMQHALSASAFTEPTAHWANCGTTLLRLTERIVADKDLAHELCLSDWFDR